MIRNQKNIEPKNYSFTKTTKVNQTIIRKGRKLKGEGKNNRKQILMKQPLITNYSLKLYDYEILQQNQKDLNYHYLNLSLTKAIGL